MPKFVDLTDDENQLFPAQGSFFQKFMTSVIKSIAFYD